MTCVLDIAQLTRSFTYDPTSGALWWAVGQKQGCRAGTIKSNGYRQVHFCGRLFLEHRLIWAFIFGVWPPGPLDHRDRNRSNNRIDNLRLATVSQNGQNSKIRAVNSSGSKGVSWYRPGQKWRARIVVDGREVSLGYFHEKEDAAAAYAKAAQQHFAEFARLQ